MDTSSWILVTGAAGFMGSHIHIHIVDALVKAGYTHVTGMDDLNLSGRTWPASPSV